MTNFDHSRIDDLIGSQEDASHIRDAASALHEAASGFWRCVYDSTHLSPRLKELVLLALHASSPSLNETAIERHVVRAKSAGASEREIMDVLLSIVGVANHSLYFAVPILLEECKAAGREADAQLPPLSAEAEAIRDDFITTRGFWNDQREVLARLMPNYFKGLSVMSMEPWKSGALEPKERQLIYIAIDCSITHMHEPGLRVQIRNAIRHGATREEILEVFQLSSLMGTESYVLGCRALIKNMAVKERAHNDPSACWPDFQLGKV